MSRWGMKPREYEIIRHILTGSSVVDGTGPVFEVLDEVDSLLRLNKLDWSAPGDARYLQRLLAESVRFLESTLERKVIDEVARAQDVRDIFLLTRPSVPRRVRTEACFTLKVMNTINHVNGRELLFHVPISERDLASMVFHEVKRVVDDLRLSGFPIVNFEGGEKSRESLILKLLAKRETLAAQVYDKIRFRVTVEDVDHISGVILHFARHLFPFNYVIPGQSRNELVHLPGEPAPPERDGSEVPFNESSGPTYQHLDFVVDLPLRIDAAHTASFGPEVERLGNVVYAMVEFQITDRRTAETNESGGNNHEAYKRRQHQRVLERLARASDGSQSEP